MEETLCSKQVLAPAAPARIPTELGLQGQEGSAYVSGSLASAFLCTRVRGVSTAAHGPPLKNHSVTGKPCAHDPFSLCSFSCDSKEGTWTYKLSGLNESLDAPRSRPSADSATSTLPTPASPSCCVILPCTIWALLRATLSTVRLFLLLFPLTRPRRFSSPSCGPAHDSILSCHSIL